MAPDQGQTGTSDLHHEDATKTMAQAFKDLAKGEQTAAAMEGKLTALEQKIDALLASVEDSEAGKPEVTLAEGKDSN